MARPKSGDGGDPPLPSRGTAKYSKRLDRPLGRPVNSDGEETRHRILLAARECFAAYGYAATTNRIIAERSGYTAAAVYHHFGRKNDLMLAVYQMTELENFSRMRAAIDGKQTILAKVQAILDVTHRLLVEDRAQAVFMFVAREEAKRHAELAEISRDRIFADLFAEIVSTAVDNDEVDPADAKYVRAALMVLTAGLANMGTDLGPSAHKTATESCKRLIGGTLFHQGE
jgi:AcrR family transcriptional regulator